jgi:uncharacterized membrane protein YfcA
MGLVVAGMGLQMAVNPVQEGRGDLAHLPDAPGALLTQAAAAGAVGGVMGGAIGVPGPPVILWARAWFTDLFFRTQIIAVFTVVAGTLPAMLWVRGLAEPQQAWKLLVLLPMVPVGNLIGIWLAPRLSRHAFGRLVGVVLVGTGGLLLVRAGLTLSW